MMKPFTQIMTKQEEAVYTLRSLYHQYGYAQFKMSKFEEYELYLRNKDFLISDSILTFTDPAGRLMALKPDVTLSIVKNLQEQEGAVTRVCYDENVYRVPRGSQTAREIMQVGLECMGAIDAYCMYEVISLAVQSLAVMEFPFVLSVSHLGIVTEIIDACGFSGADAQSALHWVGEKNAHELHGLCEKYALSDELKKALLNLVKTYGSIVTALGELMEDFSNVVEEATLKPFADLLSALACGEHADSIWVDFSVLNDIHYYNGIVFQGYVKGLPDGILSGGQYDGLMQKLGRNSGAVGFAVYLDQLERLDESDDGYDVDVLLVYDDSASLSELRSAVQSVIAEGKTVQAVKSVTDSIRCKELRVLREGKLEVANA